MDSDSSDVRNSFSDSEYSDAPVDLNNNVEDNNDDKSYEENQNNDNNIYSQNGQCVNDGNHLQSGLINVPPLLMSKSNESPNLGFATFTNIRLPPLPVIDFLEIHQNLKTRIIDPFDIYPKDKTQITTNENQNISETQEGSTEVFNWRVFQLPDVPDVDDTEILDVIHKKFDLARLVDLMRNFEPK